MDFEHERQRMVERQLRARGIGDRRVLGAMATIPRERFVPERLRRRAYADGALPIGGDQTISQPWIVAAISQALELEGGERVLEIGTGSGYSTAVLAQLAGEVVSVERISELAERARATLATMGVDGVEVRVGDGTRGAPDRAPFDAIAVHAGAPGPPASLLAQLRVGGRLVIPVSADGHEVLCAYVRTAEDFDPDSGTGLKRRDIASVRFVPLLGEEGFEE